jgi:ribosomal protein L7Ae-like RNA K-turn-binding protein
MGKRKAAQTVDAASGRVVSGVESADGLTQLVRHKTKALRRTSTGTSTTAVKAALDDPLRAAWLPLASADASAVLERVHADLHPRTELCAALRRAHTASTRLRASDAPPAPTEGVVAGLNAVSAHMERGSLALVIVAKDAWPSACIQHLPLQAHLSTTPLCLLADAAQALGATIGAAELDAVGFCAQGGDEGQQWREGLVRFVRSMIGSQASPNWYAYLPLLAPARNPAASGSPCLPPSAPPQTNCGGSCGGAREGARAAGTAGACAM